METKTIRFEKGKWYSIEEVGPLNKNQFFSDDLSKGVWPLKCIKSFTVQINIIEDDREDI